MTRTREAIAALALAAGPLWAAPPAPRAMTPVDIGTHRLAEGIYQFTVAADGYVEQLNSVAIVTDVDVVVFDTTTRPSTAEQILREIRKLTPKPVRYVVNSHWHPDHWSGNQVFTAAFPGVEIIATERERDLMMNLATNWTANLPRMVDAQARVVAEQNAKGVTAEGLKLTPERRARDNLDLERSRDMAGEQARLTRVFPTLTYSDRLTLHHGGREFRFISVTGDAAATTVLFLPRERILITGDVISYPLPYYTPPLSEHARSIRELLRLDFDLVVPGHGPAMRDRDYMTLQAELFEALNRQVVAALRKGAVSIDQVQAAIDVAPFRDRFARGNAETAALFGQYVQGMVRRIYVEQRDGKSIQ